LIRRGRGLVQLSGPTDIPERVLRAVRRPSVDFRTRAFAELVARCRDGLARLHGTRGPVHTDRALGHGAREEALVDLVVGPGEGSSSRGPAASRRAGRRWPRPSASLSSGSRPTSVDRFDPAAVGTALRADRERRVRCLRAVHLATSTGIHRDSRPLRAALGAAARPARLLADANASPAAIPLEMEARGVAAVVAGPRKGLLSPPGRSSVTAGPRGLEVARTGGPARRHRHRRGRDGAEAHERFSGTPPARMIFELRDAPDMLAEEGLPVLHARHARGPRAVRAAVARWAEAGAITCHCLDPEARADTVTALTFAPEIEPERSRERCRERYGVAFGGIGPFRARPPRLGHTGELDAATIPGALRVLALASAEPDAPHELGDVEAAVEALIAG